MENGRELNPQPQFEIPKTPQEEGQEATAERAIEQRQVSEGASAKQTPKFPTQIQQTDTPAQIQQTGTPARQIPISSATADLPAHDTDLIEKEWVERAKHIVAQTQDDPFKQKNEMSKAKADYIKKRFDKTIPVDDAAKS